MFQVIGFKQVTNVQSSSGKCFEGSHSVKYSNIKSLKSRKVMARSQVRKCENKPHTEVFLSSLFPVVDVTS